MCISIRYKPGIDLPTNIKTIDLEKRSSMFVMISDAHINVL